LQKDVKEAICQSGTLFISYLTATIHDLVTMRWSPGHLHDHSNAQKTTTHKATTTIQVEHIYKALEILEFETFVPILKRHLEGSIEIRPFIAPIPCLVSSM
jgi:hypothetical protein